MKRVQLYQKVRRAVLIDGDSRRKTAAYFGISRKTVASFATGFPPFLECAAWRPERPSQARVAQNMMAKRSRSVRP